MFPENLYPVLVQASKRQAEAALHPVAGRYIYV